MLVQTLLLAHIVVLGYWLGSELVINNSFRYVTWSTKMPIAERGRMLDHVMDIDQHVRYALVLQLGLGVILAALLGYIPGGASLGIAAGFIALLWLVLVQITHRRRKTVAGEHLARLDRVIRYLVGAALVVYCLAGLAGIVPSVQWLALKMMLFAIVIVCGVGIRFELIKYFGVWSQIRGHGSSENLEAELRHSYFRATAVLVALWVAIGAMTFLSLTKPDLGF